MNEEPTLKPAQPTTNNPFDEPTTARHHTHNLSNPFLAELQNASVDDDPDSFTVTRAKRSKKPKAQTIFMEGSGKK